MMQDAEPTSRLNLRVLAPLLVSATMAQVAVQLIRVGTSYRAVELDLPLAQVGALSSAFALLPVLFAVQIGRYNDRHGEGNTALLGAFIIGAAVRGLWLGATSFVAMLAYSCLLGVGQVMSLSAQQMMTTRCSEPAQHDRVLGMFLVSTAMGQVLGPLAIAVVTPAGALYPDARLYWLSAAACAALLICAFIARLALPPPSDARERVSVPLGVILRTPGLPAVLLASSLCLTTNDLMTVFFPVLGAVRGIDASTVGLLLSLRAVASMVSRLAFARLTMGLGKVPVMVASLVATAIATGLLVLDLPVWAMAPALALAGFSMGLAIACSLSLTLVMAPAGGKATAMSLRLTISRFGQFMLPLGAGAAATVLGPGSIFALMGIGLCACGAMLRTVPRPR